MSSTFVAGRGLNTKIVNTIPNEPLVTLVFTYGSKGEWLKLSRAVNSNETNAFRAKSEPRLERHDKKQSLYVFEQR